MSGGGENPCLYAPAFQFGAARLAPPHQPQLAPWFNAVPPLSASPFHAAAPHKPQLPPYVNVVPPLAAPPHQPQLAPWFNAVPPLPAPPFRAAPPHQPQLPPRVNAVPPLAAPPFHAAPPHQPQLPPRFNAAPPLPAPPFRAAPPHLVPRHQHHQRANGGAFNYPHLQQQPCYQQQLQLPLQQQPLQPLQQQPVQPLHQQPLQPLQQQLFQLLQPQPVQPLQQQPRVTNFCSKSSLSYAPPPPLQQSYTPLPKKRHLEDGDFPDLKRSKVTMQVVYIPVMDFLDKNPPIEPYQFRVGSTFGNIPEHHQGVKITEIGATVVDGYVELFGDTHNMDKSFGGEFDENDLLVSEERPWSVTINKVPKFEASSENRAKDYNKLVTSLVLKRYIANGKKPPYADEFISRIKRLRSVKISRREINLWIIRNHPFFIESAKRRLFLEDFYKWYKTIPPKERHLFIMRINCSIYHRWHLLIAPKDAFISFVYWKGREKMCPADHFEKDYSRQDAKDEKVENYPFTSADAYLAAFLRHLIVHGPEDAVAVIFEDVELEELDLIIAYYFERFLPIFLDEISTIKEDHQMLKEILTTYAYRRSVSRGWLPI